MQVDRLMISFLKKVLRDNITSLEMPVSVNNRLLLLCSYSELEPCVSYFSLFLVRIIHVL